MLIFTKLGMFHMERFGTRIFFSEGPQMSWRWKITLKTKGALYEELKKSIKHSAAFSSVPG